jgi:predicted AlkP superfamily pyrophosphatase or phosphodiesterase
VAVYGRPPAYPEALERELGAFPFFDFWGPRSGLPSSRWIADAASHTLEHQRPALTLAYLPHLDYTHQRHGPDDARSRAALREVDAVFASLLEAARRTGTEVVVVSEYGIEAVDRPVHPNRALREAGLLEVRPTPVGEVLDTFASAAFAVSDHQVAHVYARTEAARARARDVLHGLAGVEPVLEAPDRARLGIDHPRAGDLVAVAAPGAWFTYYYWLDDAQAPDFARTVDIHRKPGYDPCELFVDPALRAPRLRVALRLAQKLAGMRYLVDVIPLDPALVRGSHGRPPDDPLDGPVLLGSASWEALGGAPEGGLVDPTSVCPRVLALLEC